MYVCRLLLSNLYACLPAELEKQELEDTEEWSEDMAQNEPLPGEVEDVLPEEREKDASADD